MKATDYLWGVSGDDSIWRCKAPCLDNAWQGMGGRLKQVDVGKEYVYGTAANNTIWRCKLPCDTSAWEKVEGGLKGISGP